MVKGMTAVVTALFVSIAVTPAFAQTQDEARKEGESCGGALHRAASASNAFATGSILARWQSEVTP
jgi:hypothetical protein